ncbi:MAG: 30S ribosomal protein S15 [Candidatus Marinimicrobia bacterium]|nr:30S ribosomal protein S15 [Candidatus Neomarinimicrobiota bacterium]|tara:strand:- start:7515 stop:7784 length:270 start_codon:yes stop_codon:yes gene_type:complete
MTLTAEKTKELAKKFGKDENDAGAVEVQVAILTERIRLLEDHFNKHKKDNHSRRGLIKIVSKRRKLLKYLIRRDYEEYQKLIKELGIRR